MTTGEFAEETAHRDRKSGAGSHMEAGDETPLNGLLAPRPLDTQVIQRRAAAHASRSPVVLLQAQRAYGNRFVQRAVAASRPAVLQRKCECGGTCEKCQAEAATAALATAPTQPTRVVQARAGSGASPGEERVGDDVIPSASVGRPLDERTRGDLESQFNADLSSVRVHTDTPAAAAAETLGADAFTTGSDIYFAEGRYAPGTRDGQHLLAHEVAHTVQQSDGRMPEAAVVSPSGSVVVGASDDKLEKEADVAANMATGEQSGGAMQLSADPSGQVRRRSARETLGAAWDATGGRVGGLARSGWQATGGRAIKWAGRKIEETIEWVRDWLEENAPTLMAFLRSNPIEVLKGRIQDALDEGIGAVVGRIKQHGLFGALTSLIAEGATALSSAIGSAAADACSALRSVVEGIIAFQKWQASTAWKLLSAGASAVAGLFSSLWNDLALPAWNAVKKLAGKAWNWIEARAKEFWALIKPLRDLGARIWALAKRAVGIAWDTGTDLYDWIKAKAEAAWDRIKTAIQPFMGPLKVIGAILLVLSPLGPIVLIGALAYGLYQAARWLYNNWDQLEIVIKARQILRQTIIPAINSAVAAVRNALNAAVTWLGEQAKKLGQALAQLAEALGVNAFLRLVKSGIDWIKGKIDAFATWASGVLKTIADAVLPILTKLRNFFQPILVVLLKLAIVIANPLLWPIYISAVVWMALPECVKPPIINYILDILIAAIKAIPEFKNFGETWPQIRSSFIRGLEEVRGGPMERKVELANRVASMIAGGDLEGYGNLIEAARQMPQHFIGQTQEELIGMNLGEPLPFEREPNTPAVTAAPTSEPSTANIRSVNPAMPTSGPREPADVSHVASLDLTGDFVRNANLGDGRERVFGENNDPANSLEAIRSEFAEEGDEDTAAAAAVESPRPETLTEPPAPAPAPTAATDVTSAPAAVGPTDAPIAAMTPDEQLAMLMQDATPMPCESPAGQEKQTGGLPREQRTLGPFTPEQRASYMWHQIKRGISGWYECNKVKIWAAIITAVVLLIVDLFLTGGATVSTIMEVIGAIMIGVAIVRIAGYVAEYIAKSILGDITGAAKALARGLAAGAIEIVFALMFNLGALIKRIKGAVAAMMRAMERVAPRAARVLKTVGAGTARVVHGATAGARRVGTAVASGARRVGGAIMRQGKIILDGLPAGFSRGIRSMEELAQRLWARLRFRRFKLARRGLWIQLWGEINPWILLAEGNLRYVDESAVTGIKQGEKAAVKVGDELLEGLLVRGGAKPDYRFIADVFAQQAVSNANVIHHAIEQQVLKRFKNLFTVEEVNGVWNLRTILKGPFNSEVHLSKIRQLWNSFYPAMENARSARSLSDDAVKEAFRRFSSTVDDYIAHMTRFMETNPAVLAAAAKGDAATVRTLLQAESQSVLSSSKFATAVGNAIQ